MKHYKVSAGEERLDREEIVDFLSKIFGKHYNDSRLMQEVVFDLEPSISPENFILARSEERELIGVVRIVERNILLDGVVLTAGCISSVGVKPEWRNRGVASSLMKTAIAVMTLRGIDISILHGRKVLDGFYLRFGYYGVGRYIDLEILSSPRKESSLNAVPFKDDNKEMCMKAYNETYSALSGSVLRDHCIWEYLLVRMKRGLGGFEVLVCLEGKDTLGYLVIFDNKLIEISLPPQVFSDVPNLLCSLGVTSIAIHPRHSFYVYCRTRMNTIQKERFALDGGYMARILNHESLLRKLRPAFVSRASAIGMTDKVIRVLGYECDLGNGRVSKTSKPDDITFKRDETAVQLFLGVIPSSDIIGVHWVKEKPWTSYLFPELYFHTSSWDEV